MAYPAIVSPRCAYVFQIQFAITAQVGDDGSAKGHINFVFQGEFAQLWAVPPGADMFRINGKIDAGSVSDDGTITLTGNLMEFDYRHGKGLHYTSDHFPEFTIVTGGDTYGTDSFSLQWCELPPFHVDVPAGTLHIH